MVKSILFIVIMFVVIMSLTLLIEKIIPKSKNLSALKLYLIRVSIGIIPAIILGIILFFIFLK